jgi:hypothetical protein
MTPVKQQISKFLADKILPSTATICIEEVITVSISFYLDVSKKKHNAENAF